MPAEAELVVNRRHDVMRLRAIAHDMRTPLTTMSMAAELLLEEDAANNPSALIMVIGRQVRRFEHMLGTLEPASSPLRGSECPSPPIDLASVVRECVEEFRLTDPGHEYVTEVSGDLEMGNVDPELVRHIMQNLLGNASGYAPRNSSITTRLYPASRPPGRVIIEVEDEGPGIPDTMKQEIFNPFVRLGSDEVRGEGLGLHIVQTEAVASGGAAWVEDGLRGALFRVCLNSRGERSPLSGDAGA